MARPYVGNSVTGVVHDKRNKKDPCRVSEIKLENRENFETLEAALNTKRGKKRGYRPCKKCCAVE